MTRLILTGFWVCALTLLSSLGAAQWASGRRNAIDNDQYFQGLKFQKIRSVNVPMIADGAVQGYIVAQFVFTADTRALKDLGADPHSFIVDEAFRKIYSDKDLDFRNVKKVDIDRLLQGIKKSVNERVGAPIIRDLLVEDFNFVEKKDVRS